MNISNLLFFSDINLVNVVFTAQNKCKLSSGSFLNLNSPPNSFTNQIEEHNPEQSSQSREDNGERRNENIPESHENLEQISISSSIPYRDDLNE
jgi:hypothetical protein